MLPVSRAIDRRMSGTKSYYGLEGLRKTTKNLGQDSRSPVPKFEPGTSRIRRSDVVISWDRRRTAVTPRTVSLVGVTSKQPASRLGRLLSVPTGRAVRQLKKQRK
ncbi:hypothetical protein L798_10342 [Zootermopsis nevadensis]|uniref:Uncharacterized protein n=1 Tax=Zootermopsis nevadensis TaxID=136037 RepID=A0A067RBF2_ZOONE|nr:hypothetical protein L798_10342 [Zootermopsis nevadensis]